jgi:acyl-CoA synthetase (AMP-forming)/AMP-acid ligase II
MVWVSPYGSVVTGGTLDRMVAESAARFGERPALVDGTTGHVVNYSTLASRMARVSAGLTAWGFGAGDVLALWAPNMPQWAGVALAAMAAGGTVTGINPAYVGGELGAQLADSGASVLVTIPSLVPTALAAASASGVREVFVLGEAAGATSILDLVGATGPAPEVAWETGRPAFLPYSSGTTGLPKGVMLTHANLVASVRQLARMLGVTEEDRTLAFVPYFHIMGFMVELATPLACGATVVTMPRFDPEGFLAAIEDHRITYLAVPPPVMAFLARHPKVDDYDLSSLKLLVSGGAPLGADLQRAAARRLPEAAVGQGWGMTETTVGAAGPDRRLGTKPGSVGRIMPGTELRVVDQASGRTSGRTSGASCGSGDRRSWPGTSATPRPPPRY